MMQSFWRNWKGVDADIITKPANSPDTNLLDLGFFYAVQSANDEVTGGEGEMIQHIQQTFTHYLRQKINQTGLTYMSCLNMIIKHLGDNHYKIPHINKTKMEQEGRLPMVLNVTDAAVPLTEIMDTSDSMDESEMSGIDNDLENTSIWK